MNKTENLVLTRIRNYNKPVKTKHLAPRMGMERPDLVVILNKLQKKGLIKWIMPKQSEDDLACGWVKI